MHLLATPTRPFRYDELAELGLDRGQLRRLVADGLVRSVLHGVYAPTSLGDSTDVRAACARLVLPPQCVVVDRSAAMLHGIDAFGWNETQTVPALEVASMGDGERSRRSGVRGGERDLRPDDVMSIDGVMVTSPLRTACDLGCLRGRTSALAVIDAFRREFGITVADLERAARRFAGRRGVTQLRELTPLSSDRARSPAESWCRLVIVDFGLPTPAPNLEVWIEGWGLVELDLAWERLKIAVEYDGEEFHRSEEQISHDRRRRAALRAAGWAVIVVRKADLAPAARDRWLCELRAAVEARTPLAGKRLYARAPGSGGRGPRRR